MIKIKPVTMYYAIGHIPNFKKHKSVLLDFFEKMEGYPLNVDLQDISKTDWNVPQETPRNYMEYFLNIVVPVYKQMTEELSYGEFKIDNVWFQQYYQHGIHEWHIHPETHMSNILYVELPEGSETEIYDPIIKKITKMKVKEGDLLAMPAYIWHRSPPNPSQKRKSVLVFNSEAKGKIPFEHRMQK